MSTVRGPGFSLWGPELEQGRSRSVRGEATAGPQGQAQSRAPGKCPSFGSRLEQFPSWWFFFISVYYQVTHTHCI